MDIWKILPPLAALRAFSAWAETGSMTAAGARLNVSHAAISQQIRALEDHLGLSLLDRQVNPPRPTADGRHLATALTAGFETMARAVAELTAVEVNRPLQITTTPSFAAQWLLPRLSGFRAAHPEISLMIDPNVELCSLAPGGNDLALRYGTGEWSGLQSQLLLPTPLVVVAAPDLVCGVSPDDLASLSHLPWIDELGTDDSVAFLDAHGLERQGRVLSLPGGLKLEAALSGQGVVVISHLFVQDHIAAGRLRQLHVIENGKGYWLVHRPGGLRPPARAFARWLRHEVGGAASGGLAAPLTGRAPGCASGSVPGAATGRVSSPVSTKAGG